MFVRGEGLRNSQICLSFGAIEGLGKLTNVRPHERQTTKPPAVREKTAKTGSEKTPGHIDNKKQDLRYWQKDLILLFTRSPRRLISNPSVLSSGCPKATGAWHVLFVNSCVFKLLCMWFVFWKCAACRRHVGEIDGPKPVANRGCKNPWLTGWGL